MWNYDYDFRIEFFIGDHLYDSDPFPLYMGGISVNDSNSGSCFAFPGDPSGYPSDAFGVSFDGYTVPQLAYQQGITSVPFRIGVSHVPEAGA